MNADSPTGPFINANDEPPGRFIDGRWQGALDWCSRHGPATVQWSIGVPMFIWNARDEAGNRCNLADTMRPGVFRRQTAEGFAYVRIEISSEDVTFAETLTNTDIDDDLLPLHDILAADIAFMDDMKAANFAAALYVAIENEELVDSTGTQIFELGQRSAARLVAALRNNGEIYVDYAWGRGPAFGDVESKRVQQHLNRLGIRPRSLNGEGNE